MAWSITNGYRLIPRAEDARDWAPPRCHPDASGAPREEAARMMLTPKVTPITHMGPSPYAPLVVVSTARK